MASYRITWVRVDVDRPWPSETDNNVLEGHKISLGGSGIQLSNIIARYGVTKEEIQSDDGLIKMITYSGTADALSNAKQEIEDEVAFSFDDISSAGLTRTVEYID